jgi:hypothetical protein
MPRFSISSIFSFYVFFGVPPAPARSACHQGGPPGKPAAVVPDGRLSGFLAKVLTEKHSQGIFCQQ